MATAKEVIDSAAFRIGLKKEGIDLETSEYNTGIALLNDMMFELDAINIKLGYSEVSAQTDSITIPSYALGMVKAKMAIKLNGEFPGTQLTEAMVNMAAESTMIVKRRLFRKIIPRRNGNMPIGNSGPRGRKYYRESVTDNLRTGSGVSLNDGQGKEINEENE